jgi:hypothetical protein
MGSLSGQFRSLQTAQAELPPRLVRCRSGGGGIRRLLGAITLAAVRLCSRWGTAEPQSPVPSGHTIEKSVGLGANDRLAFRLLVARSDNGLESTKSMARRRAVSRLWRLCLMPANTRQHLGLKHIWTSPRGDETWRGRHADRCTRVALARRYLSLEMVRTSVSQARGTSSIGCSRRYCRA